jgi:hypothetical protein
VSLKIIGYTLLSVGVAAIILSTVNIYLVFTHKAKPVQFFSSSNSTFDLNALINSLSPNVGNSAVKKISTTSMLNQSAINDGLNLTLHIVLIGIIAGAGSKLASLGVLLLRNIEVKLLENPIPVTKKVVEAEVR